LAITVQTAKAVLGIKNAEAFFGAGSITEQILLARDARNLSRAQALRAPLNVRLARVAYDYNLVLIGGQSLSQGQESWPRLSTTARTDCFMIGDSVRCFHEAPAWRPVGALALNPLLGSVESTNGTLLSDEEAAALPVGNPAKGENPVVGMTNYAARAFADLRGSGRKWVAMATGVGGKTIEDLSAGSITNLYARVTQALSTFSDLVPGGQTKGCIAFAWLQGESNYDPAGSGDATKAGYKTKLTAYKQQLDTDVIATFGQDRPPVFLTYQTGATYTRDVNELAIGMAQWEFARETPGAFMVGPAYPYTDKGGHLDANGSRWIGQQFAKVFHRTVVLGEGWEPLSPLWIEAVAQTVYIGFLVPEPPLVFDVAYVVTVATDYPRKGFRITDAAGDVPITNVRILGATIVALECARAPGLDAKIWYADKAAHNGNGNLRDSDPTVANDDYAFNAGSGQYAGANIAALVGKPYPLWNWAIAFCLPTGWSR
jgi:hypothetical protein